jgi:hypothetical protein
LEKKPEVLEQKPKVLEQKLQLLKHKRGFLGLNYIFGESESTRGAAAGRYMAFEEI